MTKLLKKRIIRLEDYISKRPKKLNAVDFSNLTGDDLSRLDALDWSGMNVEDCQAIVDEAIAGLRLKLARRMGVLFARDPVMATILATFPIETLRAIVTILEIDTRRKWSADDVRRILDYLPRSAVDAYLRFLDMLIAERAGEEQE